VLSRSLIKFHKKPVQLVKKPCKEWKEKAQSVPNMTSSNNEPTFLDMNDLCDDSLEALIQHYLKLKHRMPDNISVRERLLELEREQFEREKQTEDKE
jgi:hypothetical protein